MQVMIISLAWLSGIALAQLEFSEAVTGSVIFPDGAIACLGNLAVFLTSLLRGRLDLENGVRDVLATNRGPKLREIGRRTGLTTCTGEENYKDAQVVMLSKETSNYNSIGQFMKYVYHSHGVASILLKILPLEDALDSKVVTAEPCSCEHARCGCIVLWTEEEKIRKLIARRMPGTLKPLSLSQCLLPSWSCLRNGCHGCNEGLLYESPEIHAEQSKYFRLQSAAVTAELCCGKFHDCNCHVYWTDEKEMRKMVAMQGIFKWLSNSLCIVPSWDCLRRGCHGLLLHTREAVCQMLDESYWTRGCICIPVHEAGDDEWTKLMIRFMRSKDQVTREVRVGVSDAMEKYIDGSADFREGMYKEYDEDYSIWFLIVPRLIEVLVNIMLTGWLKVDGFSSALIARRVVRDYVLDGKGTGFSANAFLTSASVVRNESSLCQVLSFRDSKIVCVRTLSYVVGSVNLICSITWGVLIACEKRFGIHSMPPSKRTLVVMLVFIGVALLLDFLMLMDYLCDILSLALLSVSLRWIYEYREENIMFLGEILLETVYIVVGTVMVVKGMGIGKWVYGALQALIWIKWAIGSYMLGDCNERVAFKDRPSFKPGIIVYSTAFMLNAVLAGVRGKWEY